MKSTAFYPSKQLTCASLAALALSLAVTTDAIAAYPEPLLPPDLEVSLKIYPDSTAYNINKFSEVTGSYGNFEYIGFGNEIGVVWNATGIVSRELLPIPEIFHSIHSRGYDINKKGVVAGITGEFIGIFEPYPAIWDAEGNGTALKIPAPHTHGQATAINKYGKVIGFTYGVGGNTSDLPVIWDSSDAPRILKMPSDIDPRARPHGISNKGHVVATGRNIESGNSVPILWGPDGTPSFLPLPAGYDSGGANGLNPWGGVVVGSVSKNGDSLTRRAIKWRKNGTKKLLPPLPDDDYSIALSINRHGVVLGYSYRESGTKFIKTIVTWNRKGVPTAHRQLRGFERLDNLGDINEKGEFVGTQFRFDDPQIDKSTRMGTIWY